MALLHCKTWTLLLCAITSLGLSFALVGDDNINQWTYLSDASAFMEKVRLRGQLQTVKNNYALVQLSIALIAHPNAQESHKEMIKLLGANPEIESFGYITYVFGSDELLKHATSQFRSSVLRNCLKELFELILAYVNFSNQLQIVKSAPWYQFLRIVRNSLSHDMTLRFSKRDLAQLPVTWSGLTIDSTMDGTPLQQPGFLTRQTGLQLIDEVIHFVEDRLV